MATKQTTSPKPDFAQQPFWFTQDPMPLKRVAFCTTISEATFTKEASQGKVKLATGSGKFFITWQQLFQFITKHHPDKNQYLLPSPADPKLLTPVQEPKPTTIAHNNNQPQPDNQSNQSTPYIEIQGYTVRSIPDAEIPSKDTRPNSTPTRQIIMHAMTYPGFHAIENIHPPRARRLADLLRKEIVRRGLTGQVFYRTAQDKTRNVYIKIDHESIPK